jgi:hypothetical protein
MTCADADTAGTYTLGHHDFEGSFDLSSNDLSGACVHSDGNDVVAKVRLAEGEAIWATLDTEDDASLYLIENCATPEDCLASANDDSGTDSSEHIFYVFEDNQDVNPDLLDAYLVADLVASATGGTYQLGFGILPYTPMADTCGDADTAGALTTGTHAFLGEIGTETHDYKPGTCQSDSTVSGALDVVAKVQLEQDQRLVADFRMASDGITYLVTNCADIENTCEGGSDNGYTAEHFEFFYQETGTFVGYLILDGYRDTFAGAYQAAIEIAAITSLDLADEGIYDTCASLTTHSVSPFGTGFYVGDVTDYTDASNLPSATSCTGYSSSGNDLILPVDLLDGEKLTAVYTCESSDASIYLLSTCDDVSSCIVGADDTFSGDTETLTYTNDSGVTESLFLFLDNYSGGATFTLDLTIEAVSRR